jgi:hypothetical protein
MRQNFLSSKLFRGAVTAVLAGALFSTTISCDDDREVTPSMAHKITYKAEIVLGGTITGGTYYDIVEIADKTIPPVGQVFTKEYQTIAAVGTMNTASINVKATGTNPASMMTVKIFVDDKLMSEKVVTGVNLDAATSYKLTY